MHRHWSLYAGATVLLSVTLITANWPVHASWASPGPNPTAETTTATCPDGSAPNRPKSVAYSPYGSAIYTYSTPTGTFTDLIPPASFNPLTAPNDQLVANNFDPRPNGVAALSAWTTDAEQYKGADQTPPQWCTFARPSTPTGGASPLVHVGHNSWSGYANTAGGYEKVVGHFYQPTISGNTTNGSMSQWIGLNGSLTTGVLIQAGTSNEVSNPTQGSPWWELYCTWTTWCNAEQLDTHAIAVAGDDVSMAVWYNPDSDVSYYQVAINGVLEVNVAYSLPPGYETGDNADYITERRLNPTRNLLEFDSYEFLQLRTYASWNNSAFVYFGSQPYLSYEMTDNGGFYTPPCTTSAHILAYPAYLSASAFEQYWCRLT